MAVALPKHLRETMKHHHKEVDAHHAVQADLVNAINVLSIVNFHDALQFVFEARRLRPTGQLDADLRKLELAFAAAWKHACDLAKAADEEPAQALPAAAASDNLHPHGALEDDHDDGASSVASSAASAVSGFSGLGDPLELLLELESDAESVMSELSMHSEFQPQSALQQLEDHAHLLTSGRARMHDIHAALELLSLAHRETVEATAALLRTKAELLESLQVRAATALREIIAAEHDKRWGKAAELAAQLVALVH